MRSLGRHSSLARELGRLSKARERRRQGRFLVEGGGALEEGLATGSLELLLCLAEGPLPARAASRGVEVYQVTEDLLQRLAPSDTPQGLLGVARIPGRPTEELLAGDFLLFLEDLGDPGNVGALLRTGWACGVDAVLCAGGADPFGPKAVRASAGAVFHVPVGFGELQEVRQGGHTLVAGVAHDGTDAFSAAWPRRVILMLGNEARGLSDEAVAAAALRLTIPMGGGCESLNASVSGSLLLYEYRRSLAGG